MKINRTIFLRFAARHTPASDPHWLQWASDDLYAEIWRWEHRLWVNIMCDSLDGVVCHNLVDIGPDGVISAYARAGESAYCMRLAIIQNLEEHHAARD